MVYPPSTDLKGLVPDPSVFKPVYRLVQLKTEERTGGEQQVYRTIHLWASQGNLYPVQVYAQINSRERHGPPAVPQQALVVYTDNQEDGDYQCPYYGRQITSVTLMGLAYEGPTTPPSIPDYQVPEHAGHNVKTFDMASWGLERSWQIYT